MEVLLLCKFICNGDSGASIFFHSFYMKTKANLKTYLIRIYYKLKFYLFIDTICTVAVFLPQSSETIPVIKKNRVADI
jgi:hypothetical protein